MDFTCTIHFYSQNGIVVERIVAGQFYPCDDYRRSLDHLLWLMAEEYGRPDQIQIDMKFWGDQDGKTTPKRIEGPKTETPR